MGSAREDNSAIGVVTLDHLLTEVYSCRVIEVVESTTFGRWIRTLRDPRAVARINARLRSLSLGHAGDVRAVGNGVRELRIHHGPGYRVYFLREAETAVMLCGGSKDSQQRDIERAWRLAQDWRQR